jgi:TP901 family phage tail tape measure protein
MGRASAAFQKMGAAGQRAGTFVARSMNRIIASAQRAKTGIKQIGQGLKKLGGAARNATLAMAPLTLMVGAGVAQAASFEQGMADVQAVLRLSKKDMAGLTTEAKRLGAETQFSATEAAGAMQNLARAGFNAEQTIAAVGGVTAAAAADGIDLATSAEVVSGAIKGMGLNMDEAAGVANVLANTSGKARTDIAALGENLRFTMAQARTMKVGFGQLTAALGVTADSLGKTTVGGTSLTQMMVKMSKPSKEGLKIMQDWGVKAKFAKDGQLDLAGSLSTFLPKLNAIKNPIVKARKMTELFGIRGQKAFAALTAPGQLDKLKKLAIENEKQMLLTKGAAQEMADIRMDTLQGQFTIFKSSMEAFSIEVFTPLLSLFKIAFKRIATFIGGVATAIGAFQKGGKPAAKTLNKIGHSGAMMAEGISDGITLVRKGVAFLITTFDKLKSKIAASVGGDGIRTIAKIGTLLVVAGAAMAPVLAGLVSFGFIVTTVIIPAVAGIKAALIGVFTFLTGPVGLAIAAAVILFIIFRDEIMAVLLGIKQGFMANIEPVAQIFGEVFDEIKLAFGDLMSIFSDGTQGTQTDWIEVGRTIGAVLAAFAQALGVVIKFGVTQWRHFIAIVRTAVQGVKMIFSGDIIAGFKKLSGALLDFVLDPLRKIVAAMIAMADAIPGAGDLVPKGIRTFAKEGISGAAKIAPRPKPGAGALAAGALGKAADKDAAAAGPPRVDVTVPAAKPAKVEVKTSLMVEGREVALAQSSHTKEVSERAGFKATPWQRRLALEHGVTGGGN